MPTFIEKLAEDIQNRYQEKLAVSLGYYLEKGLIPEAVLRSVADPGSVNEAELDANPFFQKRRRKLIDMMDRYNGISLPGAELEPEHLGIGGLKKHPLGEDLEHVLKNIPANFVRKQPNNILRNVKFVLPKK